MVTGYLHERYVASLAEYGRPFMLPRSGAWILRRPIADAGLFDAMGCYPLFACSNWRGLPDDLAAVDDLVALSVVTDPFGDYDRDLLEACFPERTLPFKEHFVTELASPPDTYVSRHHARYARKASRELEVEHAAEPQALLAEWCELYAALTERHRITGIAAFSQAAFALQLAVPGLVAFRALRHGRPAGILLWYVSGDVAYYHLGAYSSAGYEHRASFALFWYAIEFFSAAGVRLLDLGAGPGLRAAADGLTRFKRGWATGTRTAYFCGRIFDEMAYRRLAGGASAKTTYFPAYREGEFGRPTPVLGGAAAGTAP